ncbi:MAG: zeta toxin family protein, partial [Cyanobacteriota bacterium]
MLNTINSNLNHQKTNLNSRVTFNGIREAEKAIEQVVLQHKDVFKKATGKGIKKLTQIIVGESRDPQLILLGGKSASGKTTVAELLTSLLAKTKKCITVNMDNFFRDRSKLVKKELDKLIKLRENAGKPLGELTQKALTNVKSRANLDLPGAIRHLKAHDELIKLLKKQPAQIPIYDFPTASITGYKTVKTAPVVIGDSLHALTGHYTDLPALRVGIVSNQQTLLKRWWGRMAIRCPDEPKAVTQRILTNAEKQAKRYITPVNKAADIIIDNTRPI